MPRFAGLLLFIVQSDSARDLEGLGEGDEAAAMAEDAAEGAAQSPSLVKPDLGGVAVAPPAPTSSPGGAARSTKPDLGASSKAKPDLGGKKPML